MLVYYKTIDYGVTTKLFVRTGHSNVLQNGQLHRFTIKPKMILKYERKEQFILRNIMYIVFSFTLYYKFCNSLLWQIKFSYNFR